jgi:hypothetical protein
MNLLLTRVILENKKKLPAHIQLFNILVYWVLNKSWETSTAFTRQAAVYLPVQYPSHYRQ